MNAYTVTVEIIARRTKKYLAKNPDDALNEAMGSVERVFIVSRDNDWEHRAEVIAKVLDEEAR